MYVHNSVPLDRYVEINKSLVSFKLNAKSKIILNLQIESVAFINCLTLKNVDIEDESAKTSSIKKDNMEQLVFHTQSTKNVNTLKETLFVTANSLKKLLFKKILNWN